MTCVHTHLAVLAPIDYAPPDGDIAKLDALEEAFGRDNWPSAAGGVLADSPMVHMARFQIVDHFIPDMGVDRPDMLRSRYLLFIAELDGSADDFYDHLYHFTDNFVWQDPGMWGVSGSTRFVEHVWGNCAGFPSSLRPDSFRVYMREREIEPAIQFASAQGHCAHEIIDALLLQRTWMLLSTMPGGGPVPSWPGPLPGPIPDPSDSPPIDPVTGDPDPPPMMLVDPDGWNKRFMVGLSLFRKSIEPLDFRQKLALMDAINLDDGRTIAPKGVPEELWSLYEELIGTDPKPVDDPNA